MAGEFFDVWVGECWGGMGARGDPNRAFDSATAAVRRPGTVVRVELIGDSTQTDHAGYGRGFCARTLRRRGGLREYGAGRGEHADVSGAGGWPAGESRCRRSRITW